MSSSPVVAVRMKIQASRFFSVSLTYSDKPSRFSLHIIKINVHIIKIPYLMLGFPSVSCTKQLRPVSFKSPIGSVQVPPSALGQVSSLFPSPQRRCRWPYREGLYAKTVRRGLEILGNHMVLLILRLSKDLSSQIRVFHFQGEEGKRKKKERN